MALLEKSFSFKVSLSKLCPGHVKFCLKCRYCRFSSHFCFLVVRLMFVLFLVNIISLFCSVFLISSSSRLIDVSTLSSMLVSPLLPSILDTYSLSSLGYKALCIDMSCLFSGRFVELLPSSILRWSEYLTRGTAKVLIPLMSFLPHSLVSSSFSFSWGIRL